MNLGRSWRVIVLRLPQLSPDCLWVTYATSDAERIIERYARACTPAAVIVTGARAQPAPDLSGRGAHGSRRAVERSAALHGAELLLAGYRVLADPALSARINRAAAHEIRTQRLRNEPCAALNS